MGGSQQLSAVTATDGPVAVERVLEVTERGVLVTYTLVADAEGPVEARVADGLPSNWEAIAEIGVHPEFEPAASSVDADRIVFEDTVPPEDERVVRYGIISDETPDVETLDGYQSSDPPVVEAVDPGPDAASVGAEGAASAEEPPTDPEGEGVADDGSPATEGESSPEGGEDSASGESTSDEPSIPEPAGGSGGGRNGPSRGIGGFESIMPAARGGGGGADTDGEAEVADEGGAGPDDEAGEDPEEPSSGDPEEATTTEAEREDATGGDPPGSKRDGHRSALERRLGPEDAKRAKLRLGRLHSSLTELAGYLAALQVIGDYESAAVFLDHARGELEAAQDELDVLQGAFPPDASGTESGEDGA